MLHCDVALSVQTLLVCSVRVGTATCEELKPVSFICPANSRSNKIEFPPTCPLTRHAFYVSSHCPSSLPLLALIHLKSYWFFSTFPRFPFFPFLIPFQLITRPTHHSTQIAPPKHAGVRTQKSPANTVPCLMAAY